MESESTIKLNVVYHSIRSHSPATTTIATRRSARATAATAEDVDDDVNDCDYDLSGRMESQLCEQREKS